MNLNFPGFFLCRENENDAEIAENKATVIKGGAGTKGDRCRAWNWGYTNERISRVLNSRVTPLKKKKIDVSLPSAQISFNFRSKKISIATTLETSDELLIDGVRDFGLYLRFIFR